MANHSPNKAPSFFDRFILGLPQLIGLPILDNDQEEFDDCKIQFYISIAILSIGGFILILPTFLSNLMLYILQFNSNAVLLWQITGSITSNFAHGSWSHLLGNMYFFLIFAPLVEKNMALTIS